MNPKNMSKQNFTIDLFHLLLPLLLLSCSPFCGVHGGKEGETSLSSSHSSFRHTTKKGRRLGWIQQSSSSLEEEDRVEEDWDSSTALASFSSRFLPHLYDENNNDDEINQCSSIWSISMAFDLVFPGSTNPNKEQMCQVLGFTCIEEPRRSFRVRKNRNLGWIQQPSSPEEEEDRGEEETGLHWSSVREELETRYDGSCEECATVKVANSIWIDDGDTTLREPYQEAIGSHSLFTTDFDDPAAGSVVNQWINDATNGLIEAVFPDENLQPATLIAVNSVYLNAAWETIFLDTFTNTDKFYMNSMRLPSQVVMEDSHFMHAVGEMRYSHDVLPGYQLVQLGYQMTDMSMILALPTIEHDDDADEDSMPPFPSHEVILQAIPQLYLEPVALALPKFKFGTTYTSARLKNALQESGLTEAFEPNAFCGMIEDECLFITDIIQKTSIEVHELGITAACATGITGEREDSDPDLPPSVILFQADHPFFFYIVAEGQDFDRIILFEGYVQQPVVPTGALPPTFNAHHTDDDFWTANFADIDSPPWQP